MPASWLGQPAEYSARCGCRVPLPLSLIWYSLSRLLSRLLILCVCASVAVSAPLLPQ